MVVVIDATTPEEKPERRRFATLPSDLQRLLIWLGEQGVEEAVMESTAQYWRSVWLELEPHMRLHLAPAFSNRAPRGRKHDFKDAERLVRRLIANELILSFVPGGEPRRLSMASVPNRPTPKTAEIRVRKTTMRPTPMYRSLILSICKNSRTNVPVPPPSATESLVLRSSIGRRGQAV
jgi:hypothetical protein